MSVRVRFAPSPTGALHLGAFRTAIFAYLFAKGQGGSFLLRIEDTDQKREKEGSVDNILRSLHWLGLDPDEGVYLTQSGEIAEKGDVGPYTQSKRLPIYHEHIKTLVENGKAYRCFCTPERLAAMREEQQKNHLPPRYDRLCRSLSLEESTRRAEAGESFVIRQAMPNGEEVICDDLVRGRVVFKSDELDDHVLLKSDGFPTYQLASVVDDHLMQITHVLRAEEWLPSLPKNLLLYKAFSWEAPQFAHLPVVLGSDGKRKLSKREGAIPVLEYAERGYLPEAVLNFTAFLGWSPGTEEEFFTKEELAQRFRLERVQKAGAVFNQDRFDFVNGWYIRQLPVERVVELMRPYLLKAGLITEQGFAQELAVTDSFERYFSNVAAAVQQRLKHFDESEEVSWFFFKRPVVDDTLRQLIIPKRGTAEETYQILKEIIVLLELEKSWITSDLEVALRKFIEEKAHKPIAVLWPIRAALTGTSASPGTFEMLAILGKEESMLRLKPLVHD